MKIGDDEELFSYLDNQLKDGNKELFIVVSNAVSQSESWKVNV